MLSWSRGRQPLCNDKEAIFILMGHAVSKATWCNHGIPAKPKPAPVGFLMLFSPCGELPTRRLSHTGYPEKYNIHASSFPTAQAGCWQEYCNILGVWFSLAISAILICDVPEIAAYCNCLASTCCDGKRP